MELVRPGGDVNRFDIFDKLKLIFSDPNLFFEKIASEEGIGKSFATFVIIGLIFYGSMALLFELYARYFFGSVSSYYLIFLGVIFIISIIMIFIYTSLVHIGIKISKGTGDIFKTFNVCVYSSLPAMILAIIPMIGLVGFIYSIILATIGLSKIHGIAKWKAALSYLWPIIAFFTVILIIIINALSYYI